MSIKNMHYDFKMKMNKVDSQSNRNFLIPEIDWLLNEAAKIFVNKLVDPRGRQRGIELSQRAIADLAPILKTPSLNTSVSNNIAALPQDYWYFVKADCFMDKGSCTGVKARVYIRQHDDEFEESHFHSSSFEWRHVNAVFDSAGLRLFTDGTFVITELNMTYIKTLAYMHNAEDFRGGTYKLPGNPLALTLHQDCELPVQCHSEIVDIAVLLASGQMQSSAYPIQMDKINNINQLI